MDKKEKLQAQWDKSNVQLAGERKKLMFAQAQMDKNSGTKTAYEEMQKRRIEKATSNICSNQALIGLCATLYLSVMGEKGFKQAGYLSSKYAHELSKKLEAKGIKTLNKNFFNEFVIEVADADKTLANLKANGIIGGLKLDNNKILVATTEMNSPEEIDLYAEAL